MRFQGKLTTDEKGKFCLNMNIAQGQAEYRVDVDLSELLEPLIGKEVTMSILEVKGLEDV